MFDELIKENHNQATENFNKRIKLAQAIGNAKSLEEARKVSAELKVVEEETKDLSEQLSRLHRFKEMYRQNPSEDVIRPVKKGISLT